MFAQLPRVLRKGRLAGLLLGGAAIALMAACASKAGIEDLEPVVAATPPVVADAAPATSADPGVHPEIWPELKSPLTRDPVIEAKVQEMLASMTVEEKVAQLVQGDISSITPADVAQYKVGSVLNGGSSGPYGNDWAPAEDWLKLADEFWEASVGPDGTGIPVIWGTDAVHGNANVIGATIFPHNIGLGAANDPELIKRIGEITAIEIAVTGLDWTFAPTVATPRDDRWGRTYEGYSEDGEIVKAYAGAMVEGLQGKAGTDDFLGEGKVISTIKHFLGDGGTDAGLDQGETIATEEELRDVHASGYISGIEAGAQSVMASYSSWQGQKMHGRKALLTDVLVGRFHFDGFVVGDWNGHGQVKGCTPTNCPKSLMAGLDMYMAPDSWKGIYESLVEQVKSGEVPMERLDEAAGRILRVKLRYGIFERGKPSTRPLAGRFDLLGSPEHRAVAREAVRKSLVLLKNNGGVLPIRPDATILVAGDGADSFMKQAGGWTVTWQGTGLKDEDFPNADTIYDGIVEAATTQGGTVIYSEEGYVSEKPDVAIVVFGEDPYAEGVGDIANLDFTDEKALATLKRLKDEGIPVVSVFLSGRSMWVNPELNLSDAFVAAWLPGSEGEGIADVLIAKADGTPNYDFQGRLSFSWPKLPTQARLNRGDEDYDPLFAYGYGLSYGDTSELGQLDESAAISRADSATVFARGGFQSDLIADLSSVGAPTVRLTGQAAETANGGAAFAFVDTNRQEDTMRLSFSGVAPGGLSLRGVPTDWSAETKGDISLKIDYRLDKPLDGAIGVSMACGFGCGGGAQLDDELDAQVGEWGSVYLPLKCFSALDASQIDGPIAIRSQGENEISILYMGYVETPDDATCPN